MRRQCIAQARLSSIAAYLRTNVWANMSVHAMYQFR